MYEYNILQVVLHQKYGMVPISKCVPEDDGYHVPGALVVAPERAMQYATTQLRRAMPNAETFRFL
jgi:hypothetical protein